MEELGTCVRHRFGNWLEKFSDTRRAWMPHIGYYDFVSFTDGRHRFAWCRDHGVKSMPVSVPTRKQAVVVGRLFGSSARICRLPRTRSGAVVHMLRSEKSPDTE